MSEHFDDLLQQTLARREPPPGFAERVIARSQQSRNRSLWRPWLAVAASVLAVFGGLRIHQRRQAEQARDQAILALRITAEALAVAQNKVQHLNSRSIPQ